MSLVEPGVFDYLPYTLAIINTLRRSDVPTTRLVTISALYRVSY